MVFFRNIPHVASIMISAFLLYFYELAKCLFYFLTMHLKSLSDNMELMLEGYKYKYLHVERL